MDTDEILKDLYPKLKEIESSVNNVRVTALPDFFIDRVIRINDPSHFIDNVEKKISVGGGSIRGLSSIDIKGGNAVNVAYGLAKLGIKIDLFTIADQVGAAVLHSLFQPYRANVNINVKEGKHGLTTVFEFASESTSSNVMISDVGDNDNFDSETIDSPETIDILNRSNAVILTNWASNFRATDLMRYVFLNSPNAVHIIDPADVERRCFEFIHDLKDNSNLIDFLSMNENEYNQVIDAITSTIINNDKRDEKNEFGMLKETNTLNPKLFCRSVQSLSNFLKIKVCIHTVDGSAFSDGSNSLFVKSIPPSHVNILSGAGDSWDAAFLFGHLFGFTSYEKLCFANLISSLYVENLYGGFPSLTSLIEHIQSKYF